MTTKAPVGPSRRPAQGGPAGPLYKDKLPPGWRWAKLGDVCDFLDSQRVPINDTERQSRIAGKPQSALYPYYGANGQVGWIDDFLFDEPLILLAEDGGFFGSIDRAIAYKIEGKAWVNNHAHVLRPKSGVDLDFCLYSIAIRPDVGQMVTGNTRPKLNQEIAAKIPFMLPPLPEQCRIARILNEQLRVVEKARAAIEAQLEAAQALPSAYLREVFPKPGQPLPPGWRVVKIEDVASLLPSKSIATDGDMEVLAVTTACLTESGFDPSGVKIARMWSKDVDACYLAAGEVLIARSNTSELVGRAAMFDGIPTRAVASDLTIRLWHGEKILPAYLASHLSFLFLQGYWRDNSGGASGSMKKITRAQVISLPIILPDLIEQRRIVDAFRENFAKAEALRSKLSTLNAELTALPQSFLRKAFSGAL
jgi:type I restriction enzyme S subunit